MMNWLDGILIDRLWMGKSKIWDKPEMAGFPYLKPWKEILRMCSIATAVYLVLALPVAWLIARVL